MLKVNGIPHPELRDDPDLSGYNAVPLSVNLCFKLYRLVSLVNNLNLSLPFLGKIILSD
jgi:hypothetical protein